MASTQKLETLLKRQAAITQRIAQVQASEKARARKEDTRLKVLIGAAILSDVGLHPETRAGVEAVLKRAITAERDAQFLKEKGWLP